MPQVVDLTPAFLKDLGGLQAGLGSALQSKLAMEELARRKQLTALQRQQMGSIQAGHRMLSKFDPDADLQETMRMGQEIAGQMPARDRSLFLDQLGEQMKSAVVERRRSELLGKIDQLGTATGDAGDEHQQRLMELRELAMQADDPDEVQSVVDDLRRAIVDEDMRQMYAEQGAAWATSIGFDPTNPALSSRGEMQVFADWKRGLYDWDERGFGKFVNDMLEAKREGTTAKLSEPQDDRSQHALDLGLGSTGIDESVMRSFDRAYSGDQAALQSLGGGTASPAPAAGGGGASPTAASPTSPAASEPGAQSGTGPIGPAGPAGDPEPAASGPQGAVGGAGTGSPRRVAYDVATRTKREAMLAELKTLLQRGDATDREIQAVLDKYGIDGDTIPESVVRSLESDDR